MHGNDTVGRYKIRRKHA
uniref:Uncharacterized protein n=1 Tax=Lepeophtheirus salmonis TaxID=72036 RepID=A0A0K2V1J4_LEPSM